MKFMPVVKTFLLVVLSVVLVSCTTGAAPTSQAPAVDYAATINAVSTQSSDAVKAIEQNALATLNAVQSGAVATVGAQVMQTVAAIPTATPYPTAQPPAASAVPATATPLPTSLPATAVPPVVQPGTGPTAIPSGYSCRIVSQSPSNNPQVQPGYDFDTTWVVKNTGSKTWSLGEVDYRYSSGTKFQKYADVFDLPQTVSPGAEVTLTVDMAAPAEKGYYYAAWALIKGNIVICYLTTEITVK